MKLIFIYGPPAVGKLTVAKELEKITGYKLFHNHLVHDLVESVIDFNLPVFNKQKAKLYLEMLTLAAKVKTPGIIFTFCYSHRGDAKFINEIIKSVTRYNGEINFVQIVCDKNELFKRVKNKTRKKFNKIKTHKTLKEVLLKHDLFSEIPGSESLCVNNTKKTANEVAQAIKRHYNIHKIK